MNYKKKIKRIIKQYGNLILSFCVIIVIFIILNLEIEQDLYINDNHKASEKNIIIEQISEVKLMVKIKEEFIKLELGCKYNIFYKNDENNSLNNIIVTFIQSDSSKYIFKSHSRSLKFIKDKLKLHKITKISTLFYFIISSLKNRL